MYIVGVFLRTVPLNFVIVMRGLNAKVGFARTCDAISCTLVLYRACDKVNCIWGLFGNQSARLRAAVDLQIVFGTNTSLDKDHHFAAVYHRLHVASASLHSDGELWPLNFNTSRYCDQNLP